MRKISSVILAVLILLLFAACQQDPGPMVKKISLDRVFVTVSEGNEFELNATVEAEPGADTKVSWATDKESVATVDRDGKVKGLAYGAATITATAGDKKAICLVIVAKEYIPVESVTIDRFIANIIAGDKIKLNAIVAPVDAKYEEVTWSSKDESIATVNDNGEVVGVQAGKSTIITATVGDKSGSCVVVVLPQPVPVTSITLGKESTAVAKDSTAIIKATVEPENATYYKVIWESSDESIVAVSDGVVTGLKSGSATITAKAGDKTATCRVDVVEERVAVTFDANDGSGKTWVQVLPKDCGAELADYMFSRDGFIFVGWNATSDYTGDIFYDGETVKFSESKTLYAQWVPSDVFSLSDDGTLGKGSGFSHFEFPNWFCLPRSIDGKPVKTIGDELFENETHHFKQIKIPSGVTQIGRDVFYRCPDLEWLYLPNTLEGFNAGSFSRCPLLHFKVEDNPRYTTNEDGTILLDPDKTIIYSYPTCPGDLVIEEGIKEIGPYAFYWMEKVTSVVLPESLEIIGDHAFYDTKLKYLTIPAGVRRIEDHAFTDSHSLEGVITRGGLEYIGVRAFSNCDLLRVTIGGSVDTIGESAFDSSTNLKYIVIGGDIKTIGPRAFGSVMYAQEEGLLMLIYGTGAPAEAGHDLFDRAQIYQIRVPAELVDTYKNAKEWSVQAQYIVSL